MKIEITMTLTSLEQVEAVRDALAMYIDMTTDFLREPENQTTKDELRLQAAKRVFAILDRKDGGR